MSVEPPKIDKLLAANLAKAKVATKDKPYFYALVLKGGGTSGKLLVDRLKIKEPQILSAKKLTGGSAVVIGVCHFDRQASKLVFETTKPPLPTWAQLVKKLAREEAKLSIEVKFELAQRKLDEIKEPEPDKEEAEAQPEEGASEPKGALENWNLLFEALKAKLVAAGKAGKPWAKELWLKQSEAGAIYRQGKTDQAHKMLMEVELLLKQKQSAAQAPSANGQQVASGSRPQPGSTLPKGQVGTGAATSPRPAFPGGHDNTLAGIDKRLQFLLPAYRGAKTGPHQAQVTKLWEAADRFRTNGDFAKGMKELDALEKLLAAGTPVEKPTSASSPAATAGRDEFKTRLKNMMPAITEASTGPDQAQVMTLYERARHLRDSGDFAKALKVLDDLAPLVAKEKSPKASELPAAAPQPKGEARPFSIVNVQAARLTWVKTRKKVQEELDALVSAIRRAVEAQNTDQAAKAYYEPTELDQGVTGLFRILDHLDTRLIDKLDEALNAEGQKRQALNLEARTIVREYRTFLENDPLMKKIDQNPFLKCSIRGEVDEALGILASKL